MIRSVKRPKKPVKLPDCKCVVSSKSQQQQRLLMVWIKKDKTKKSWYLTLVVVHMTFLYLNLVTAFLKYWQPMVTPTWEVTTLIKKLSTGWQTSLKEKKISTFVKTQWHCSV